MTSEVWFTERNCLTTSWSTCSVSNLFHAAPLLSLQKELHTHHNFHSSILRYPDAWYVSPEGPMESEASGCKPLDNGTTTLGKHFTQTHFVQVWKKRQEEKRLFEDLAPTHWWLNSPPPLLVDCCCFSCCWLLLILRRQMEWMCFWWI